MPKTEARKFDLGITWNWEHDREFINKLNDACVREGLRPYIIHHYNLYETIRSVRENLLNFRLIFDRASDTDHRFSELIHLAQERGVYFINQPDFVKKAIDKILFHMELVRHGIPAPPTFIYYPTDSIDMLGFKLRQLGTPVVMKPAGGMEGGGVGVLLNAQTIEDIIRWHNHHQNLVFLLQKQILPTMLGRRPAWFRIFYCLGKTLPCWWNPATHIYEPVTAEEIKRFHLKKINDLTGEIAKLSKLDFFSTEITKENKGKFLVIDYINDQCDMRCKSQHYDGVPDEIINRITALFTSQVRKINKAV